MRTVVPWSLALLLAACGAEPTHEETQAAEEDLTARYMELADVTLYAAACKAEMGLPPETLAPMNCLDGVELPVRVNGTVPELETYEALVAGEVGCDNPSWIGDGEPCANYSFIVTRQLSDDVVAALFCRQRTFSSHLDEAGRREAYAANPTPENFTSLFGFETLGLIWTHTTTGATCFFERVADTYGGYVAMPDDPTPPTIDQLPIPAPPPGTETHYWEHGARSIWKLPMLTASSANCATCHDSGPFIRSGYVHDLDILPPHSMTTPYYMASHTGQFHQERNKPRALWTTPIYGDDGEEPQICTSCHRIGASFGCDQFTRYYTGQTPQPGQDDTLPFHERVLMPPPDPTTTQLDDTEQVAAWSERYQRHVDKLRCCCEDPSAIGCSLQDITQSPLPTPVAGTGPGNCEL